MCSFNITLFKYLYNYLRFSSAIIVQLFVKTWELQNKDLNIFFFT